MHSTGLSEELEDEESAPDDLELELRRFLYNRVPSSATLREFDIITDTLLAVILAAWDKANK